LVLVLLTAGLLIHAQKKELFTINPGQRLVEAIPDSAQYMYPTFLTGNIFFRDDRNGTAKLNYNILFEEMMFLNPDGDTLAIGNAETIRQIVINKDTFFFNNVFVKQVASHGDIKLGMRKTFRVIDSRKMGAMGLPTSNTVRSFRAVNTASDLQSLIVQEVLTLEKTTQFYLGDKFNKFQFANRTTVLDLLPGKRKLIKTYLKNNDVNFINKGDIIKMLIYLQQN
jgi:hypothetical protein